MVSFEIEHATPFIEIIEPSPFTLERHASIGEVAIMYAAWGEKITADEYLSSLEKSGVLTADIKQMVEKAGFEACYRYPDTANPYSTEFQEMQIRYGVAIAETLLQRRGWDSVDVLSFASISSLPEVVEEIVDRLTDKGYSIGAFQEQDLACYGGFAPIADFSQESSPFYKKKALTIAVESLTGKMMDPDDHSVWWTFGNGGSGMAWIPGIETEHIYGETIINTKLNDAIEILPSREPPPEQERLPGLPPGYEYDENIADDEEAKKLFYWTKRGKYMIKAASKDGKAHMNPRKSIHAFGIPVVEKKRRVIKKYNQEYAHRGPLHPYDVSHMPSRQVKVAQRENEIRAELTELGLEKKLVNTYLTMKIDTDRNQFLSDHNIENYHAKQLLWTLTELNNVSSAVSLIDLAIKANQGQVPLDTSILFDVYGIGVIYGNHVIQFHRAPLDNS